MVNLVWLQGASDTGCTISFLNADQPDVVQVITKLGVNIAYHPTISPANGPDLINILDRFTQCKDKLDVLVVEGSAQLGPNNTGNYCLIGEKPFKELVKELAKVAGYTIAVGTCAAFGGIPAGGSNPTDATGLQFDKDKKGGLLGTEYTSKAGLPVINIPGCPAHPDWILQTLAAVLLGKLDSVKLDEYHRPLNFFGEVAHQGCSRNEYFEYKISGKEFTDPGCMYMYLGCKAPFSYSDCNIRLWNRQSSCTRVGAPCIGCVQPNFPEETMPFFKFKKIVAKGIRRKLFYLMSTVLIKFASPKRLKAGNPIIGCIKDTCHFLGLTFNKIIGR